MFNLACSALHCDELFDIGMCIIEHKHKSAPPGAALLDHISGGYRVELCPGTGTRCRAVDGLDIGAAWTQCREVNTDTATACHDLGHNFQVIEDTLATVFRAWYNIAVV